MAQTVGAFLELKSLLDVSRVPIDEQLLRRGWRNVQQHSSAVGLFEAHSRELRIAAAAWGRLSVELLVVCLLRVFRVAAREVEVADVSVQVASFPMAQLLYDRVAAAPFRRFAFRPRVLTLCTCTKTISN
jgi:hypothetical protein